VEVAVFVFLEFFSPDQGVLVSFSSWGFADFLEERGKFAFQLLNVIERDRLFLLGVCLLFLFLLVLLLLFILLLFSCFLVCLLLH